jgi:hypothetical protein
MGSEFDGHIGRLAYRQTTDKQTNRYAHRQIGR